MRSSLCICALVFVSFACSGRDDSAAPAARDLVLGEPAVVIGADDAREGHALYRVSGAFVAPDGRLFVANAGSSDVRVFSPAGELLRTFGTKGNGPGEHQFISQMWLAGDTAILYDPVNQKVSYWSLDGALQREVRVAGDRYSIVGRLEDGRFIGASEGEPVRMAPGSSRTDTLTFFSVALPGDERRPIARVPYQTLFAATIPGGGTIYTPLPLKPRLTYAVDGSNLFLGYPDRPSLDRYDASGARSGGVSLEFASETLTPEIRRAWQAILEERASESERPAMKEYLESLPYPETMPFYDRVVAGGPDRVWVRRFAVPGRDSATWSLFDHAGTAISTMRTPVALELLSAGDGRIIASQPREDGAEQVMVWTLAH